MKLEKFKIKILVLDSGERVVLIVDSKTAIPHLEINRYLFYCRKPVLAFKSLKKEAETICFILNNSNEIFGDWSDFELLPKIESRLIFDFWNNLKHSNVKSEVSVSTHMYRWLVFKKLFDYWTDSQLLRLSHIDNSYKNLAIKKKILLKEIDRLRTRSRGHRLVGLDKKVLFEIIKKSRVKSENNPWITRDRLRNQLIFDMLIRLGLRSGELLKVSLGDFNLSGQYATLTVTRKINDKDDPRKDEPRVKTFGRILEIDSNLANDISLYLKERRSIPNAKKSKFLLVAHTNGKPLSDDSLNRIISSLNSKEFNNNNVTPHSLRRSWNDLFREYAETLGINSEIILQTQNYLQGRILNSSEAYKYSAKYIEKSARETHLKFQKKLLDGDLE